MRILVVEDEPALAALVGRGLTEEGHAVDAAGTGEEACAWMDVASYDAVVLDIMLPGMGGLEVCRVLRRRGVQKPILLLTARDRVDDRVAGLDAGADDYLVKPFAFAELFARLRALSRRPPTALDPVLGIGDLLLDPATHRVSRGDREIVLSSKEFRLLEHLLRHPGRVLTRTMIAEHLWDYDGANLTNVIDVHIGSLRRKLHDPYPGHLIQTVRGVGYRVRADA